MNSLYAVGGVKDIAGARCCESI